MNAPHLSAQLSANLPMPILRRKVIIGPIPIIGASLVVSSNFSVLLVVSEQSLIPQAQYTVLIKTSAQWQVIHKRQGQCCPICTRDMHLWIINELEKQKWKIKKKSSNFWIRTTDVRINTQAHCQLHQIAILPFSNAYRYLKANHSKSPWATLVARLHESVPQRRET